MAEINILIENWTGLCTAPTSWAASFDASEHKASNHKVQKKKLALLFFW